MLVTFTVNPMLKYKNMRGKKDLDDFFALRCILLNHVWTNLICRFEGHATIRIMTIDRAPYLV